MISRRPAAVALLSKADLLKLDLATRLELIEELWGSIGSDAAAPGQLPLTARYGKADAFIAASTRCSRRP